MTENPTFDLESQITKLNPDRLQQVLLSAQEEREFLRTHVIAFKLKGDPPKPVEELPSQKPREFIGREGRKVIADKLIATHGVYGNVWAGKYEGDEKYSVAVKVAHFDQCRKPEDYQRVGNNFQLEADVLKKFQDEGWSIHTPSLHNFHQGSNWSDPPYIVMDLVRGFRANDITNYPERLEFKLNGKTVGHGLEESLALEITKQLIEAYYYSFLFTNYDRSEILKGALWDPEKRHLTVVDWNMTGKYKESDLKTSLADVKSFLLGLLAQTYLNMEDLVGQIIKDTVSPSTQVILERLSDPNANKYYQDLLALMHDIELVVDLRLWRPPRR